MSDWVSRIDDSVDLVRLPVSETGCCCVTWPDFCNDPVACFPRLIWAILRLIAREFDPHSRTDDRWLFANIWPYVSIAIPDSWRFVDSLISKNELNMLLNAKYSLNCLYCGCESATNVW